MDVRSGRIRTAEQVAEMPQAERRFIREMRLPLTPEQKRKRLVGRNDRCPCGSGRKFKKCCLLPKQYAEAAQ